MGQLPLPGVLLCVGLLVAFTTACPHEWAKEGAIDQAVHKDMKESIPPSTFKCPEGKRLENDCAEDEPGCGRQVCK